MGVILLLSVSVGQSKDLPLRPSEESLLSPVRIALVPGGQVVVSDFLKEGVFLLKRMRRNEERRKWKVISFLPIEGRPLGVAIDQRGRLYVGNASRKRVEVYQTNRNFRKWKFSHYLEGSIERPNDIVVSASGLVYVVASDENKVKVYQPEGDFLFEFGEDLLSFPTGIAINKTRGEILVGDFFHKCIQVFDENGIWLRAIAGGWFQSEVSRPQGLAVGRDGRVYVVDAKRICVLIFDHEGQLLATFGEYGNTPGHFRLPLDIVIDFHGNALVTDNLKATIEIFQGVAK
jgi:DNA-binding beta-propeller fold protein YncE